MYIKIAGKNFKATPTINIQSVNNPTRQIKSC